MIHTIRAAGRGAVAAGHEQTAQIGAEILANGGNAVDAVVAMVMAGTVCESTLTTIGGGGFMIIGGGNMDEPVLLDCFVRQPGLQTRPRLAPWQVFELEMDGALLRYGTGPASVAVPGIPRSMAYASKRYGRLPFAQAAMPAAELAAGGAVMTRTQASEHDANSGLLLSTPEGRKVYLNEAGNVRVEGELFQQPDLAASIEEIALTDGESLYTGGLARKLLAWSDELGGRIGAEDLRAYALREREPLSLDIDGVRIFTNPLPAMGGGIVARLLQQMLSTCTQAAESCTDHDLRIGQALVKVLRAIDPPLTRPPAPGELVAGHEHVPHIGAMVGSRSMSGINPDRVVDSSGNPIEFDRSPSTTHVSAIDGEGLMAGATCTVGYGSGEFIPDTGIQLNNMLAEYDHRRLREPGATVPSMMSPSLLIGPTTSVQIGSAGSDRIPHALSQILDRMWHGTRLDDAVRAPRWSFDGTSLHCEPGISELAIEQLEQFVPIVRWPDLDPYFGTANGSAARLGEIASSGDPRRQCSSVVVD